MFSAGSEFFAVVVSSVFAFKKSDARATSRYRPNTSSRGEQSADTVYSGAELVLLRQRHGI